MSKVNRYAILSVVSIAAALTLYFWYGAGKGRELEVERSNAANASNPDLPGVGRGPSEPEELGSVERVVERTPEPVSGDSSPAVASGGQTVRGSVQYANGDEASGVLLAAYGGEPRSSTDGAVKAKARKLFLMRTNFAGEFSVRLPEIDAGADSLYFELIRPGSRPLRVGGTYSPSDRIDITIPLGKCTFLVTDAGSIPVPRCIVEIREINSEGVGHPVNQDVVTDETGVAEVHFASDCMVTARARSLSSGEQSASLAFELRTSVGGQFQELQLGQLPDAPSGTVEVVLLSEGRRVEPIRFSAMVTSPSDPGFVRRAASVEGSSSVVMAGVPVGRVDVRLSFRLTEPLAPYDADLVDARSVQVADKEVSRVSFSVEPERVIKLNVDGVIREPMWIELDEGPGKSERVSELTSFLRTGGYKEGSSVDSPGTFYFRLRDSGRRSVSLVGALTGDVLWSSGPDAGVVGDDRELSVHLD